VAEEGILTLRLTGVEKRQLAHATHSPSSSSLAPAVARSDGPPSKARGGGAPGDLDDASRLGGRARAAVV
jgi:hypothetical protein